MTAEHGCAVPVEAPTATTTDTRASADRRRGRGDHGLDPAQMRTDNAVVVNVAIGAMHSLLARKLAPAAAPADFANATDTPPPSLPLFLAIQAQM